jgi:hypothetical protein
MQGEGVYSFVTSERSGKVFVGGIEASSFGMHHAAPNAYYHMHRAAYSTLRSLGAGADTAHGVLAHPLLVSANLLVGKIAIALAKVFRIV